MEVLSEIAKEHGLFVALVVYVLWDGRNRESRLLKLVDSLSESFKNIQADVKEIKTKLWKSRGE